MCRTPSAGQASIVVAENLVAGSIIERRQLGAALRDLAEFVAQPPPSGAAPQSSESLPQRDDDGSGERLASASGDFPRQVVGFRILQAERHWFLMSRNIPHV